MTILKTEEYVMHVLHAFADGEIHNMEQVRSDIAVITGVTVEEKSIKDPDDKYHNLYTNRIWYARSFLTHTGILNDLHEGDFHLTDFGRDMLKLLSK